MSTPQIEKILVEIGRLPKNIATVVHEAREGNGNHKNGHHNGNKQQQPMLSREQFRHYVFEVLTDHYQAHHQGTRREAASVYIGKNFSDAVDQMYTSYALGHHTLEQFAEVLMDTPRD